MTQAKRSKTVVRYRAGMGHLGSVSICRTCTIEMQGRTLGQHQEADFVSCYTFARANS